MYAGDCMRNANQTAVKVHRNRRQSTHIVCSVRKGIGEEKQERERGLAVERMDLDVEWWQGNSKRDTQGRQYGQKEMVNLGEQGTKGYSGGEH